MNLFHKSARVRIAQSAGLFGLVALFAVAGHLASSAVTIRTTSWESCEPGLMRRSVALLNPLEALVPWKEQP